MLYTGWIPHVRLQKHYAVLGIIKRREKMERHSTAFALLDAGGYNYQMSEYENDHKLFPDRIMLGTESFPLEALENWNLVEKHPYIIGDFVWTAIDYLGEASIGHSTYDNVKKSQFFVGCPGTTPGAEY